MRFVPSGKCRITLLFFKFLGFSFQTFLKVLPPCPSLTLRCVHVVDSLSPLIMQGISSGKKYAMYSNYFRFVDICLLTRVLTPGQGGIRTLVSQIEVNILCLVMVIGVTESKSKVIRKN